MGRRGEDDGERYGRAGAYDGWNGCFDYWVMVARRAVSGLSSRSAERAAVVDFLRKRHEGILAEEIECLEHLK